MPERYILTALLVRAGAPATQDRPRCRVSFILFAILNSILCYQSDVSGFFAQFEYHFRGENGITLKASKIVNFIIERFKLRKRRFQIMNFITRI